MKTKKILVVLFGLLLSAIGPIVMRARARLTKLGVFTPINEELGVYRWNTDISFRLFG